MEAERHCACLPVSKSQTAPKRPSGQSHRKPFALSTQAPPSAEERQARADAGGELAQALAQLRDQPEALAELRADFEELAAKLPAELRQGDDALRLEDDGIWRDVVADAEALLLRRLLVP